MQHELDEQTVADWLTEDLHPNEYGNLSFISRMAYKYREYINNSYSDNVETYDVLQRAYNYCVSYKKIKFKENNNEENL